MADLRYDGQVAIVTGAGRGIGREHALLLARRGARVVVNNRSSAGADAVTQEIRSNGGHALSHTGSIDGRAGAESLIAAALEAYGRVDILVNNAGVLDTAAFEDIDDAARDESINAHLIGPWALCQAAWPQLKQQRYGRLVMTLSSAGLWGMPDAAHYCASKAALLGLTRALAHEGQAHGIRINALAVGGATRMMTAGLQDPQYAAWVEQVMPPWAAAVPMAVLAHADCPANGEVFGACGRWMSRILVGNSQGFASPSDYTPENVRDHFGEVMAPQGIEFYRSIADHLTAVSQRAAPPGEPAA